MIMGGWNTHTVEYSQGLAMAQFVQFGKPDPEA